MTVKRKTLEPQIRYVVVNESGIYWRDEMRRTRTEAIYAACEYRVANYETNIATVWRKYLRKQGYRVAKLRITEVTK